VGDEEPMDVVPEEHDEGLQNQQEAGDEGLQVEGPMDEGLQELGSTRGEATLGR